MADPGRCACGQPLHYHDEAIRAAVETLNAQFGPDIPVAVGTHTWLVPRHYLALHGLKASELATLGFPELDAPP